MSTTSHKPSVLKMPPQTPGINRTPAGAAAYAREAGVKASINWADIFPPNPPIAMDGFGGPFGI
jgi:hypothetical protein